MNLEQFLSILQARYRLAWLVFACVVVSAVAGTLLITKQYTALASITLNTKAEDPITGRQYDGAISPAFMATQVDIISSQSVALKVIDRLKLTQRPEFIAKYQSATAGKGDIRFWLATELVTEHLSVFPSRDSSVISIEIKSKSAKLSAELSNAFVYAYLHATSEMKASMAQQNNVFFQAQLDGLQQNTQKASDELSRYQQEQGIVATEERVDVETKLLNDLSSELINVQTQAIEAGTRTHNSESGPDVQNNGLVQSLKRNVADLQASFDDLSQRNGPNHPHYKSAKAELDSARKELNQALGQYAQGLRQGSDNAQSRKKALEAALQQQKDRVLDLKTQRAKLGVMQQKSDNAQQAYNQALQRFSQTSLESRSQLANASILSQATPPLSASSPKTMLNFALALFVGALLGIGTALLAELMDRRIRSKSDIKNSLDLPLLADLRTPIEKSALTIGKRFGKRK